MARLKVFDTNALIAVSQGTLIVDPMHVRVAISIITKIELLSWPNLTAPGRDELRQMLGTTQIVEIDREIEHFSIDIRIKRLLKLPDAIVAATALSLKVVLVTNDQTFKRVPGLVLESI